MNIRCEVGLADLLRAFHVLKPDNDEASHRICALLGFASDLSRMHEHRIDPIQSTYDNEGMCADDIHETQRVEMENVSSVEDDEPENEDFEIRSRLCLVTVTPPELPDWFGSVSEFVVDTRIESVRPTFEPLLTEKWCRAVLYRLVMTWDFSGRIDVNQLIKEMSECRPIRRLPRSLRGSCANGAQVLIDGGSWMEPYRRDQEHVAARLKRLIPKGRLELLRFVESPAHGVGAGVRSSWRKYSVPRRGTPVLILSDLACRRSLSASQRASAAGEWLDFAEELARNGCSLAALIPYDKARWPVELLGKMHLVRWDRLTTVRDATGRRRV